MNTKIISDAEFDVAVFFFVKDRFLVHGCRLSDAESYGDFLIYPKSHFDIWDTFYIHRYGVDYDYFPRGRIAYRKSDNTYQILFDRCIEDKIKTLAERFTGRKVILGLDEHYQCHMCNAGYVR